MIIDKSIINALINASHFPKSIDPSEKKVPASAAIIRGEGCSEDHYAFSFFNPRRHTYIPEKYILKIV